MYIVHSIASSNAECTAHTTTWDRGRLARSVLANHRGFPADETSAIPGRVLRVFLLLIVGMKHQTRMLAQGMKLDVGEVLQCDLDLGIVCGEEGGCVHGVVRDAVGVGVEKTL